MRGRRPVLMCDAEDGDCGVWDIDHYEETCSTVDGVRMTTRERSPGWLSTDEGDFCPDHAPQPGAPRTETANERKTP